MKFDQIKRTLAYIDHVKDDPEEAHIVQDDLYLKVLEAIAGGKCDNPQKAAKEALKANNIDFPRWFS